MRKEFFEDIEGGTFYTCIGTYASGGILKLTTGSRDWKFIKPGTEEWESTHQRIFRMMKVELIKSEELPVSLPTNIDSLIENKIEFENQDDPVYTAEDYPVIATFIHNGADRKLSLHLVLYEDVYELKFGDGTFHYLENVFTDEKEAVNYIKENYKPGNKYYIRKIILELIDDRIIFSFIEKYRYDRFSEKEILSLLQNKLLK
ncbi:MAG: hypothetical protein K9J16_01935 [Melioribacteraceae bacterium]|nr:hypothetical protein [Melioribacteraceae bacterium]MCF8353026.1 hypothetical protein [Melioribacteraceae bacterium]MCF8392917.1 hypothetical protein [Melioribacteraceae bacterium]MCF8417789.1 hypothetical protein [Melioribacteraceae bacterium]